MVARYGAGQCACDRRAQVGTSCLAHLSVDSTVIEKNITYPTDSVLMKKLRVKLVYFLKDHACRKAQNAFPYLSVQPHEARSKPAGKTGFTRRLTSGSIRSTTRFGIIATIEPVPSTMRLL